MHTDITYGRGTRMQKKRKPVKMSAHSEEAPVDRRRGLDRPILWNNIVIAMRGAREHSTDRQATSVVIPKPVPTQLGLSGEAGAEMTILDGGLVLRRPASPARRGWAAAGKIAVAGDDALV